MWLKRLQGRGLILGVALLCTMLTGCYESRLTVDGDAGARAEGGTAPPDARVTNLMPDISRFDRTCRSEDDCVAVFIGNVCGCGCEMSALNRDDSEAFRQYTNELAAMCEGEILDCIGCPDRGVACDDGICEAAEICPPGEEC